MRILILMILFASTVHAQSFFDGAPYKIVYKDAAIFMHFSANNLIALSLSEVGINKPANITPLAEYEVKHMQEIIASIVKEESGAFSIVRDVVIQGYLTKEKSQELYDLLNGAFGDESQLLKPMKINENYGPAPDDIQRIAKHYKQLKRVTENPVQLNPQLAMLCRAAPEIIKDARRTQGLHAFALVHMYANEQAAQTLARDVFRFPVGSVIIKDKDIRAQEKRRDGVGGMIKRAPGYDPENGDWEYFYFMD